MCSLCSAKVSSVRVMRALCGVGGWREQQDTSTAIDYGRSQRQSCAIAKVSSLGSKVESESGRGGSDA